MHQLDMAAKNHSGNAMAQAEVGGGARIDADRRLQRPGYLIRDFIANSVDGRRIEISDYRGHSNLVLVFTGDRASNHEFLTAFAEQVSHFAEEESVIILVLPPSAAAPELQEAQNQSLVLLMDKDARLHQQYGAVDEAGQLAPVIYVTDRFGEIISVYHNFGGEQLPHPKELLRLLEFVNQQCPECEPPEWPR